ncbi:MAG: hypothetical protein ACREYC_21785, partial [Gammaproteobacteria bacterium]
TQRDGLSGQEPMAVSEHRPQIAFGGGRLRRHHLIGGSPLCSIAADEEYWRLFGMNSGRS